MQMKVLIIQVAALAATVLLAAAATPTASQDTMTAEDLSNLAEMVMPKAVMMTIYSGNVTDGDATFTVPHAARVQQLGTNDIALVATYSKPLEGTVSKSSGTGMISATDALPATVIVDYTNRTSIPVAGASAVIVLQDFKLTGGGAKGRGTINFQSGNVMLYLPDGTAQSIELDRPVRMKADIDQWKLTIDASPEIAGAVTDLMKTGATFPAGAAPVRLNDILAAG